MPGDSASPIAAESLRRLVDARTSGEHELSSGSPAAIVAGTDVRIKHFTSRLRRPDRLDFQVRTGEVLVVTGPSGCGKSSLALTMNGLIPHQVEADLDGLVTVLGCDVASAQGTRLPGSVGMVFQDPDAQLITTNVLDEVCFGLENLEVPAEQIEPRALAALDRVGLLDRRDDAPTRLSGGQRQRLALAAAIATRPRLLVLDEPTSHIDPVGAASFFALIPELRADGTTIVIVDHDLDLVIEYADRVLVLDRAGRRLTDGTPAEVFYPAGIPTADAGVRPPIAVRAARALHQAGAVDVGQPLTIEQARRAFRAADVSRCHIADVAATPPTSAELVVAQGLRVIRGRRVVLPDLSVSVGRGEFTALLGPNGAGKTTAALALAGLIRSTGELSIGGVDPRRLTMRDLSDRVGYVFQNPEHQFVTNTVADEIAHGLRRRHQPAQAINARTEELLHQLGLDAVRTQHPFSLSGGQKRRLSVATVLATAPDVLILDEPSYGLDEGATTALMGILADLHRRGKTIIMIVHDLALAADYADRIVVVRDGAITADAPTAEMLTDDARLADNDLSPLPLRRCFEGLRGREPKFQQLYRLDQIERVRP